MLSFPSTSAFARLTHRVALALCAAAIVWLFPAVDGARAGPSVSSAERTKASAARRAKACQGRSRSASKHSQGWARAAIRRYNTQIARLRRGAPRGDAIQRLTRQLRRLRRQLACQARRLPADGEPLRIGVTDFTQGWGTSSPPGQWFAAPPGVEWVRERFDWNLIEPTPGRYDWDSYDQLVLAAAQRGFTVLPILSRAPSWAEATWDTVPADPSAYAGFVAKVVARYGPGGELWAGHADLAQHAPEHFELLNEPYYPMYSAGVIDPGRYARLVKAAGQAGKAANPRAKFIVASETEIQPTGSSEWVKWTDAMYQAVPDLNRYFDAVAVHPYSKNRPPDAPINGYIHDKFQRIAVIHNDFVRHGGGDKPLWITEVGWSTCHDGGQECVSERTQAIYVRKLFSMVQRRYARFVGGLFIYSTTDMGPPGSSDMELNYGLARQDGGRKPAWRVVQTAAADAG